MPRNKQTKLSGGRPVWELHSHATSNSTLEPTDRLPDWKANSDGSIPCPPKEYGGCGSHLLELKRIFRTNLIAKIEKDAEEMASSCKVAEDLKISHPCTSCFKSGSHGKNGYSERNLRLAAHKDVDHFITSLRDEVRILKELPPRLKNRVQQGMVPSMPPVSWSNISYYLHQVE